MFPNEINMQLYAQQQTIRLEDVALGYNPGNNSYEA